MHLSRRATMARYAQEREGDMDATAAEGTDVNALLVGMESRRAGERSQMVNE